MIEGMAVIDCNCCGVNIGAGFWERHLRSKAHQLNAVKIELTKVHISTPAVS
jgi:hypothetical protein